jgi:integral membrane protein
MTLTPDHVTHADRRIAALSQLRQLEVASLAEATTLAVLVFVAVPLKHLGGWDLGVRIVGPVHGFAFVAYMWNVWQSGGMVAHWRHAELVRLILAALVPLGGFLNWPWLVRRIRIRVHAIAPPKSGDDATAPEKQ